MKNISARTAIAVPAALCLALGGALFTAGAANAAPVPLPVFTVTTPAPGASAVPSLPDTTDVVDFAGTGAITGDTLAVSYNDGADSPVLAATVANYAVASGNWNADVTFPGLAAGTKHVSATVQEINADGTTVDASFPVTFDFAVAPSAGLAKVTTDVTATTVDDASDTGIAVSGTGFAANEPITLVVGTGTKVVTPTTAPTATADANGDYTTQLVLPADAPGGDYSVSVAGTTSVRVATADFAVLGDPGITAPTAGAKLTGKSVTFSGTATPGSEVLVILDTTADFNSQLGGSTASASRMMSAAKADSNVVEPKATDPTGTFLPVGASGTWTVTASGLPADDYTFIVVSQVDDGTGSAAVNENGDPLITIGGPVEFTLAAPAAAIVPASTGGTQTLAFTGSQDAVPATIGGGLLLLVGAGLMVVARRRRARFDA
ncbi:hypothetical protein [Frondihabitans australicus]|uniref:LPXTG-motif cell wall-anchored protein n=1 Tax=Frondihabitans australicus TaxID=386892 RepID=A0A495ILW6_9MICO|nr:hypothetical protein [Frondihabitans australicus]RKR76418.1 hypothetical protein C8E83_3591 [Frondihabitans australicus]